MTILRSTPLPHEMKALIVTPPRRRERRDDALLHALNSLPKRISTSDDRCCTKFRLQPRFNNRSNSSSTIRNKKRPMIQMGTENDALIQSPTSHRRYMRRGSRTPSMLMFCSHAELLEMAVAIPMISDENATSTSFNSSHNNDHNPIENSRTDEPKPPPPHDTVGTVCLQFHEAMQMNHPFRDVTFNTRTPTKTSNSTTVSLLSVQQQQQQQQYRPLPQLPQL